jgi:hypothetical protein
MGAERRSAFAWVSLCALFALLLSARASAGVDRNTTVGDVSITVRTPWPTMLNHGAMPVLLEFENPNDDARRVELRFTNGGITTDIVTAHVDLAAKQRSHLELFLPVQTDSSSAYTLELNVRGDRGYVPGIGCTEQPENPVRTVLVLSTDPPDATAAAAWTEALHEEAKPRFVLPEELPYDPTQALSTNLRGMRAIPATNVVRANFALLRDLPTRSEAYSSIDGVVIDTASTLQNDASLAAIATWVRLGNVLAFYGRGAEQVARAATDIGAWIEPRFLVRDVDGVAAYACGQGLVLVGESAQPLEATGQVQSLNWAMESRGSWIPRVGKDRGDELTVALPGLDLPYRPLTLLLVLFAVLIGPVNFYVVRRLKKPALLLVTVPSIALLFSIGLFGYGALAQGLDVRTASETFTLLDQRAHHSSSAEVRTIFAGLSPGPGLVPGPGASAWREISNGNWRDQVQCTIDFGANVVLGGNFMPVRTPTRQVLLTDRACRLRVDVRPDGDGWIVENALGVGIRSIELCDFDGHWFASKTPIAAGTKQRITSLATQPEDFGQARILNGTFTARSNTLPPGSYAALLDASPFSDGFGIEARQVDPSGHHLVGILDAGSETESKR